MKIGFLGAGKMAEGILSALDNKREVLMAEKLPARARELKRRYQVQVTADLAEVVRKCELVFLAVRPQNVAEVASAVKPLLASRQVLVSIVAGKTLAKLREAFGPKVKLIRVMPNLALRVGAGMCAIASERKTPRHLVKAVETILGGAGTTVRLEERDFDAVTALSGSGPAYFAYMEAAMAAAGVALGLKAPIARLLAEETMFGTAKFLREQKPDLREFIAGVATPGGTTAAGLRHLAKPQFAKIVAATLAAAARQSRTLAQS